MSAGTFRPSGPTEDELLVHRLHKLGARWTADDVQRLCGVGSLVLGGTAEAAGRARALAVVLATTRPEDAAEDVEGWLLQRTRQQLQALVALIPGRGGRPTTVCDDPDCHQGWLRSEDPAAPPEPCTRCKPHLGDRSGRRVTDNRPQNLGSAPEKTACLHRARSLNFETPLRGETT